MLQIVVASHNQKIVPHLYRIKDNDMYNEYKGNKGVRIQLVLNIIAVVLIFPFTVVMLNR
jgi:hypothetical protein